MRLTGRGEVLAVHASPEGKLNGPEGQWLGVLLSKSVERALVYPEPSR